MRKLSVIALCILVVLGVYVSKIKYEVVFLRKNLNKINCEIVKVTDNLRIFGAEWSYLNNPKRLSELASKYLPQLQPMEYKQILRYDDFVKRDYANRTDAKRQAFDNLLDSLM